MLVWLVTTKLLSGGYVCEYLADPGLQGREGVGRATDEHTHNIDASRQEPRHLGLSHHLNSTLHTAMHILA